MFGKLFVPMAQEMPICQHEHMLIWKRRHGHLLQLINETKTKNRFPLNKIKYLFLQIRLIYPQRLKVVFPTMFVYLI